MVIVLYRIEKLIILIDFTQMISQNHKLLSAQHTWTGMSGSAQESSGSLSGTKNVDVCHDSFT